ncbi:acyclic terpene utilization AtuA family protein [Aliiglaciecola sp. LCG003]|uniref:acyclic terpene utilization AtuA family protein n=1 Tax=Aliiglaciecola sp. LCG003 TaxID=3053655 RepID=UPI0025732E34|nr:acyclic terpene utilization AtuA family protein [Aliiglaciecola sp. LCG003]WJG08076.1 acyclic terpene utilization AtuA family protein [Aliiglaciecola sp. LCG003]
MTDKTVRIGGASAFYGDSQLSARQLVEGGDIDYLVFDYLAEVTMAILSQAKAKNDSYGYAVDFVTVAMKDVLADCAKKGIKVIANAGGMNVPSCIAALKQLCDELGIKLNIAGVYGDDLSAKRDELADCDLSELQSKAPLPKNLASINAYLGARPIADALAAGADVVVTGRIVDSALVIAPLIHEFAWGESDYDKLAQGALAGHVLECGAQCTGGNFTDWHLVPDFSNMSYPVAEVSSNGNFEVCIVPNTGGLVSVATVGEQVLYEIGDPANYLLPDVCCDFSNIELKQVAKDRVRVCGAKGRAPGNQYKVCATYVDGYKLMSSFFMGGERCVEKAQTNVAALIKRTERFFAQKGLPAYRDTNLEIIGSEATYGPHAKNQNTREVMVKLGLHHDNKAALQFAASEIAYLATSAAPGMSGFGAGRPKPQPLIRVHSALIDKALVPVTVQLNQDPISQKCYLTPQLSKPAVAASYSQQQIENYILNDDELVDVPLSKLVYARSGDKGNNVNIGIISREAKYLPILYHQVTAKALKDYFAHQVEGEVERFNLPGFNGFNFLMSEALGGGGTASLRIDSQGKAAAQMLLSMTVKVPKSWEL